jgi:hypothetical protein
VSDDNDGDNTGVASTAKMAMLVEVVEKVEVVKGAR